ncbi:Mitochondrial inner membrane protein OXA1 [Senna tora]|uniref:Mitochondrial inner membrane protein OXA1 n=1 Tax=Senna tora TaxID=362788 RepID=A0A834TJT0_9FABA|nr:Mitochondrial inner membrane protein OXA1 [Senna tora]
MAYRRCLLIRGNLVDRKLHPSFSYALHSDERKRECPDEKPSLADVGHLLQRRAFGSSINGSAGFAFSSRSSIHLPSSGYSFCRYMSTALNQGSDKIEVMCNAADVLTDTTVDTVASQLPVVNEVAIAAADSYLPVKVLQYAIDAVHSFTGLNWWAAIVITTVLIRCATLPLLIKQLKATSKLTLMKPRMEAIKQEMKDKGMAFSEGQEQMTKLFKEYGVTPFTPFMGPFIQGPIFVSFFFAITNMTEKMQSFKHGGAYWFIDLTTPDNLYIFPVLAALSFLITIECNMQVGMEGNPGAANMKNIARGMAVLSVPFTMDFPKALFCYWITANVFSIMYGLGDGSWPLLCGSSLLVLMLILELSVTSEMGGRQMLQMLKAPGVTKRLGIPEIPVEQPTNAPVFPALTQAKSVTTKPTPFPVEPSKPQEPLLLPSSHTHTNSKRVSPPPPSPSLRFSAFSPDHDDEKLEHLLAVREESQRKKTTTIYQNCAIATATSDELQTRGAQVEALGKAQCIEEANSISQRRNCKSRSVISGNCQLHCSIEDSSSDSSETHPLLPRNFLF